MVFVGKIRIVHMFSIVTAINVFWLHGVIRI